MGKKEDNGLKFAYIFRDNMKDKLRLKNVSLKVQREEVAFTIEAGICRLSFFPFFFFLGYCSG